MMPSGPVSLHPSLARTVVDGGGGNDQITITGAAATARGGEGMDQFVVHSGDNVIDGTETGPWVDTVDYGDNSRRVVVNLVTGTAINFQFGGGVGHDALIDIEIVHGSAGNDRLIGGNPLNDSLEAFRGGDGIDTIDGGSGHDVLEADNALAGFGVEVDLHLNRARDTFGNWDVVRHIEDVLGTEYDDVMIGNAADNTFYAAVADDQIDGRGGFDRVSYAGTFGPGFAGISLDLRAGTVTGLGTTSLADIEAATGTDLTDRLAGKGGKNALSGRAGDDWINGRDGDDSLSGDGGDDTLVGGQGADIFLFNIADGHDLVSDFSVGEDRLVILGYGFANAAEVLSHAVQDGRNTVFSLADGSELILRQVQLSTLSELRFSVLNCKGDAQDEVLTGARPGAP